jgi:hypothetical protein
LNFSAEAVENVGAKAGKAMIATCNRGNEQGHIRKAGMQ